MGTHTFISFLLTDYCKNTEITKQERRTYSAKETMEDTIELSYQEKQCRLFTEQKKTLDLFLEHGAISQAQHDKSLGDLIEKMDIDWSDPKLELTDDERINNIARKVKREYHEAFIELAK